MYLFRIEVKCFSRILCLPKLLEFPHISSLLSFLILSHHELFCAIPFCNHLSLIRALLLSLSLFISSSLSIYLSALSHEESDFYHLSTDELTALCWHRSQHSDGPWTLHSPYCLSFPTLLYSPFDAPPHIVYPYSFSFLAFFISFFLFLFFIYIALLYLITGALTHSSYHARTRSYETNLPTFFQFFTSDMATASSLSVRMRNYNSQSSIDWTVLSVTGRDPPFLVSSWYASDITIADITRRIPDICFVLHMNRNICCNLKVSLPLLIIFFR